MVLREIKNLAVAELHDAVENPNEQTDEQLASLTAFMDSVGFLQPLHVRPLDSGGYEIIDGHHRAAAARKLGIEQLPAVVEEMGDEQAMLRRIGLNKHRGQLNLGITGKHLKELNDLGWDVDRLLITGFDASEISDLLEFSVPVVEETPKAVAMPEEEPNEVEKPQVLELEFRNSEEKRRAKRALQKAAGKGGSLGDGLLRLLVEEAEEE